MPFFVFTHCCRSTIHVHSITLHLCFHRSSSSSTLTSTCNPRHDIESTRSLRPFRSSRPLLIPPFVSITSSSSPSNASMLQYAVPKAPQTFQRPPPVFTARETTRANIHSSPFDRHDSVFTPTDRTSSTVQPLSSVRQQQHRQQQQQTSFNGGGEAGAIPALSALASLAASVPAAKINIKDNSSENRYVS